MTHEQHAPLDDIPPIEDTDIPDPADQPDPADDTRIFVTPEDQPYTVLLFDPDSVFAGGPTINATALIHVTASTPEEAVNFARKAVKSAARSTAAWRFPVPLFVTEGYHQNIGPDALPMVN